VEFITNKLLKWFKSKRTLPIVTEKSLLSEIALHYPKVWLVLESKYGLKKTQINEQLSLSEASNQLALPPAQILFMEIQLAHSSFPVEEISATEAQHLITKESDIKILDVRENWEKKFGSLPQSLSLNGELLKSIQDSWPKEQPILLYCHFGVRSKDAAHYLVSQGFLRVYVLTGGIDAWSVQIDPALPRYTGAYC
jgi:rhodanese-related sulfurtransferase